MSKAGRALFKEDDDAILTYMREDGHIVEPKWYLPVLPRILIDGVRAGIATGFSTFIPPHNPKEVLANVRAVLNGNEPEPMVPWYNGFFGTVEEDGPGKFKVTGVWKEDGDKVIITELPVGVAFNAFADNIIKDDKSLFDVISNESTEERPHFVLKAKNAAAKEEIAKKGGVEKARHTPRCICFYHLF